MKRRRLEILTEDCDELTIGRLLEPNTDHDRPKTRADCKDVPRPCPYVGCRYNLYLEVRKNRIRYNFDGQPWDMAADKSCALDMAEERPRSCQDLGDLYGTTKESQRWKQDQALLQFAQNAKQKRLLTDELPINGEHVRLAR